MMSTAIITAMYQNAKENPRELEKSIEKTVLNACWDLETAKSCIYSSKKDKKIFISPSVNLAKILLNQYGNLMSDVSICETTHNSTTAVALIVDLETNASVSMKSNLSIIGANGIKLDEAGVNAVNGAAISIALRTAVFALIPKNITNAVLAKIFDYLKDNSKTIFEELKREYLQKYSISEKQILNMLSIKSVKELDFEKLIQFLGVNNAIISGELKIDQAFELKPVKTSKIDFNSKKSNDSELNITYETKD